MLAAKKTSFSETAPIPEETNWTSVGKVEIRASRVPWTSALTTKGSLMASSEFISGSGLSGLTEGGTTISGFETNSSF